MTSWLHGYDQFNTRSLPDFIAYDSINTNIGMYAVILETLINSGADYQWATKGMVAGSVEYKEALNLAHKRQVSRSLLGAVIQVATAADWLLGSSCHYDGRSLHSSAASWNTGYCCRDELYCLSDRAGVPIALLLFASRMAASS